MVVAQPWYQSYGVLSVAVIFVLALGGPVVLDSGVRMNTDILCIRTENRTFAIVVELFQLRLVPSVASLPGSRRAGSVVEDGMQQQ